MRKHLFPRRFKDWLCFLLISICLPAIFLFDITFILPEIHSVGNYWHSCTFLLAMFLIINIQGNFMACLLVDTSVNSKTVRVPEDANVLGWHLCELCNHLVPPRSWHCTICQCCILKRDHHCLFVGCCIGLRNHRYFLMFITYLFIGSLYGLIYVSIYMWCLNLHIYANWLTALKLLCPQIMFLTGSWTHNIVLLSYNFHILALLYSMILLIYHIPIAMRGGVSYERLKGYSYDSGDWYKNLQIIYGKRMHLVWLSPWLNSELTNEGIYWSKTFLKTDNNNKMIVNVKCKLK